MLTQKAINIVHKKCEKSEYTFNSMNDIYFDGLIKIKKEDIHFMLFIQFYDSPLNGYCKYKNIIYYFKAIDIFGIPFLEEEKQETIKDYQEVYGTSIEIELKNYYSVYILTKLTKEQRQIVTKTYNLKNKYNNSINLLTKDGQRITSTKTHKEEMLYHIYIINKIGDLEVSRGDVSQSNMWFAW